MSVPPVTGEQYVTKDGRLTPAGQVLMQEIVKAINAIAAVSKPTGGSPIDAEARTAIDAIIDAAS